MHEIPWDYYPRVARTPPARGWLELLAKLQKAPKTLDAYARGLDDFLGLCERNAVSLLDATRGDIAAYVNDLAHRPRARPAARGDPAGLANATQQQRLTVVRLWYDYLIEAGLRREPTNPVGRGRYTPGGVGAAHARGLLPRQERQPWIPGDDQWAAFLTVALREERLRNQAMVYLAYDAALRRGELLGVRVADFDWPRDLLTIRPEIAKNRRGRVVPYGEATRELLVAYVRQRAHLVADDRARAAGPLFLSESRRNPGTPLSPTMWNKIVRGIAGQAGTPLFTPHTFRPLRLTDLARCGLELHEIALFAGHKNPQTTERYVHLGGAELGARVRAATAHLAARMRRYLMETTEGGRRADR